MNAVINGSGVCMGRVVVKQYDDSYSDLYDEIISVILDNDDISDFRDTFRDDPNNIFIAFINGFFAGVSWYTKPENGETIVGIWVKNKYRNKGCAKALLNEIDNALSILAESLHFTAIAFSDNGKYTSSLIEDSSFSFSHTYVTMSFDKKTPKNVEIDSVIINYSDELFEQMVDLRNNGIKEAESYYGEKGQMLFYKNDQEYREYMRKVKNNAFAIVNNGVLDGFVMIRGTEIMALNVRDEKRGRHYAEALVVKCIQHLRKQFKDVELICVDKNIPAYNLYLKLGFNPVGKICCYKKVY